MRQVNREAEVGGQRIDDRRPGLRPYLPGGPAGDTIQMAVDLVREDVILLSAVRTVAVFHQAEVLEEIEGPVDRRGSSRCVALAAAGYQLGGCDVAPVLPQDLDQRPALRSPALPA
jgi:hypothetical protein